MLSSLLPLPVSTLLASPPTPLPSSPPPLLPSSFLPFSISYLSPNCASLSRCACILRDTINPYMLRRLKADVQLQLPDKNEQVLFCRLTEYQCELYKDYIQSSAVEAMLDRGKQVSCCLVVVVVWLLLLIIVLSC